MPNKVRDSSVLSNEKINAGGKRQDTVLPDANHLLLLRVALSPKAQSIEAWSEWNSQNDLDDVDAATFRMLPLVYSTLVQHGEAALASKRVKGVYRFWWVRQQQLFIALSESVSLLQNAGVPVLLIKGVPLAQTVYHQPSARSMEDADLCVPLKYLDQSIHLLKGLQWEPTYPQYISCSLRHEITLRRKPHAELDVQRYPLESCRWSGFNDYIFSRAQNFDFGGKQLLMPCPEDHLVIICSHGMRYSDVVSPHWVADAVLLLRHCEENKLGFSWEKFVETADKASLRAPLYDALNFLEKEFGIGVPGWLLNQLKTPEESFVFRKEYEAKLLPYNPRNAFWLHAGLYSRLLKAGERISPRTYTRRYWNISGPVDVARIWRRHRRIQRQKRLSAS